MKTLIRIEHECGNGLWKAVDKDKDEKHYRSFSFTEELIDKHYKFNTPEEDGLILESDDFCAFKSIEQLQQWIESNWLPEIIKKGFKVWMIDVSEYKEGEYQILFKKNCIIAKKDISELFKNNSY